MEEESRQELENVNLVRLVSLKSVQMAETMTNVLDATLKNVLTFLNGINGHRVQLPVLAVS